MTRQSSASYARQVYLSSGIHGDEQAGPIALLELLREDALPRKHQYWICPVLNPVGLQNNCRTNGDGLDLNRDYSKLRSIEIRQHHEWAEKYIPSLDLGIHLHEDWEASGFYLYELNFGAHVSHATGILEAAAAHLRIERADMIDGNSAQNGLIPLY